MAGINQGVPETAIGEPIRLGSNNEFEIEQHPISDRLIIRDTVNGKVAYVRKERGGQIGGDGVLIKALKEGKPMADDGRTYDTIQQAERQASSWVFVPPGTFNESVTIDTEGLTLRGCGYNTHIDSSGTGVSINESDVTVSNFSVTGAEGDAVFAPGNNATATNIVVRNSSDFGINLGAADALVSGCRVENANTSDNFGRFINIGERGIINGCIVTDPSNTIDEGIVPNDNAMLANSIVANDNTQGGTIRTNGANVIVIGCRIINSASAGIIVNGGDSIIANNRISDSAGSDIANNSSGNILDANLTGVSN